MKECFLVFTGFDLFEKKYLFFLIPASFAVPGVLLILRRIRSAQKESFFKFYIRIAARFFVYAIPYALLMRLSEHAIIGAVNPTLSFVLMCVVSFLISVAWMGLVYDYTE